MSGASQKVDVDAIIDEIEKELKAYKDNKENKTFLYASSGLVILLSGALIYTTRSTWPLMFLVIWFGGFMYYRVHERSLVLTNLDYLSKVNYTNPLSRIHYLISAIDLKLGRKSVLKILLSIYFSASAMMTHFLFVDPSFWLNLGLLIAAIIASYFFWQSFYKEEYNALTLMDKQLHQLENNIILGGGLKSDEEE